jgi:hypothetical protein
MPIEMNGFWTGKHASRHATMTGIGFCKPKAGGSNPSPGTNLSTEDFA